MSINDAYIYIYNSPLTPPSLTHPETYQRTYTHPSTENMASAPSTTTTCGDYNSVIRLEQRLRTLSAMQVYQTEPHVTIFAEGLGLIRQLLGFVQRDGTTGVERLKFPRGDTEAGMKQLQELLLTWEGLRAKLDHYL